MTNNYLITGYWGEPHVTAENDRGINAGICGAGRFILPVGEQFKAEYIGNNTIRMYDGKLLDNGAAAGIPAGEYVDLLISNAGQGMKRNDLIVFQYSQDASTMIESGKFVVVQGEETTGTAVDPVLTQGDLLSGKATFDQMAMWRVSVSGGTISAPVQVFSMYRNEQIDDILSEVGLGTTTPQSITTTEQLDTTRNSGFYRYNIADTTICGISFTYASLLVYPIGAGGSVQELRPYGTTHCLRRSYSGGAWGDWINCAYGLGVTTPLAITTTDELDATRKNGFYRFAISGSVICGISFGSGALIVYSNTANSCVQEIRPHKTNYCLRRNYVSGTWSSWELAGVAQVLLWENASLTSNFAAQTVTVDLSAYEAVCVEAIRSTDDSVISGRTVAYVGGLPGYLLGSTDQFAITRRKVTATTTGVTFTAYSSANTTDGTSNEIPYKIYGIKGVSK